MALEVQGRPPPRLGGGRFQVVETLGDGGTATVYLAWDGEWKRWCALKALHHRYLKDEEMRRRFAQEAQALRLLRHPNIPELHHEEMDALPPYMVMELARCGSTMDWVRSHGRMPPAMAADVLFQVCQALAEAHAAGIVHRDVKPHNFLLDDEGRCKLTDFGIARVTDNTSFTTTGSQIGTFSFMAPEQRSDTKSVDHRADIYSVGASLYTLLTAKTSAELFVADQDDELLSELPTVFRSVVLRATRYKPEERYATILELQTDLMNALSRIPPDQAEYPPLVSPGDPLPEGPPKVLPGGRRFEDLEKSLALDANQPTFIDRPSHSQDSEPRAPKVIPYYMPSRGPQATAPPVAAAELAGPRLEGQRPAPLRSPQPPSDIPSYVDDAERGVLRKVEERQRNRRQEEQAHHVAQAAVAAARREQEADPDPTLSKPLLVVGLVGAAAIAVVLLLLGWGTWQVNGGSARTSDRAEELTAALRSDGSVVYGLDPSERRHFEELYNAFQDSRAEDRVAVALQFVGELAPGVGAGQSLDPAVEPKVRRLQRAREDYLVSRTDWQDAASGPAGRLAVWSGLASAP